MNKFFRKLRDEFESMPLIEVLLIGVIILVLLSIVGTFVMNRS